MPKVTRGFTGFASSMGSSTAERKSIAPVALAGESAERGQAKPTIINKEVFSANNRVRIAVLGLDNFNINHMKNNFLNKLSILVLSAILLSCNIANDRQPDFKMLCYNMLRGLQNDSIVKAQYVAWVKKIDPDISGYQEMNDFTQKGMEEFAAQYQHHYAVISKEWGYPTAVSSKYPIVNVQKVLDNMWHGYIYASINGMHVFVIHLSPFNVEKRKAEVRQVLAHAALISQHEKIVIMGDFNSISDDDVEAYRDRNLDDEKNVFAVIQAMQDAGFKDAYRMFHQDFKVSCPSKKYAKSERASRIDFVWLNPELAKYAVSADYIHDEDTDAMSDHYPLLVEFKFNIKSIK